MDLNDRHPTANGSLQKVISTRQFVFMALSSSIGAGLFLATYGSLAIGGPASLLLSFAVVGFAVWITMCALGELSTAFPVTGSFYEYSVRFISPAWGFSMGWNYVINYLTIVVFELVVMLLCVDYWVAEKFPTYYLLPAFIGGLVLVNIFGAKWYAEAENVFAICKMIVLCSFVIVAILIVSKAIPSDNRSAENLGIHKWKHGHAFNNGPIGFLYVFMAAGMAYGGTEMLGLTAAECEHPLKVMPLACKIVPARIVVLYLLPIFMLGLVLDLPTNGGSVPIMSPFVAAMDQANLPVIASIFNGIILVSIFSMASASVFASSRALQAISARGMGPSFFAKVRWGQPAWALVLVFLFSLLSFITIAKDGDKVFEWLLALAADSNYFTWLSICVCHIRLRLAIRKKGLNEDEILKWKSPVGIWGSVVAIVIFLFGLSAQIVAIAKSPILPAPHILSSVLGIVVVFICWAGYMAVKRDMVWIPTDKIDLKPKREGSVEGLRRSHDVESGNADTEETKNNARRSNST
ncbi:amino acid permease/ SLC12A domain-containing protein [Hypoxylon fuscum]|nr:amino acid permease/ SLC12A domain-containing protein [Hypoxylon fuscum]